jgi:hypothetical protein
VASCAFTLSHQGTPETLFPIARQEIAAEGGQMVGSPSSGEILMPTAAGDVRLRYTTAGRKISVEVTDKPWVVSCARVQAELANVLTRVPMPPPIDVEGESTAPAFVRYRPPHGGGPKVEVIDFEAAEAGTITVPARRTDMTRWLLVAGAGAVALGAVYVSRRKRSPKHRRRTTKRRSV